MFSLYRYYIVMYHIVSGGLVYLRTETWPKLVFEGVAVVFHSFFHRHYHFPRGHDHARDHVPYEMAPLDCYGHSVQSYNRASHSLPTLSATRVAWAHCLDCRVGSISRWGELRETREKGIVL